MKGLTIVLAGLLLSMGMLVSPAAAGTYNDSTAIAAVSSQASLPDSQPGDATLVFNTNTDSDDEEIGGFQATTLLGYSITPKVTIDLLCRRLPRTGPSAEVVRERIDADNIAQNLMVGFSYKF